jgi:uncharacterized membrane protein (DUF373 family)
MTKKKFPFLILIVLVLLAGFIRFMDLKVFDGFVASGEISEHFTYLFGLLVAVGVLIAIVLYFEKKSTDNSN